MFFDSSHNCLDMDQCNYHSLWIEVQNVYFNICRDQTIPLSINFLYKTIKTISHDAFLCQNRFLACNILTKSAMLVNHQSPKAYGPLHGILLRKEADWLIYDVLVSTLECPPRKWHCLSTNMEMAKCIQKTFSGLYFMQQNPAEHVGAHFCGCLPTTYCECTLEYYWKNKS